MKRCALLAMLLLSSPLLGAAKIDTPAPNFSLRSNRDETRTLRHYRGNVLFINFWASWCAPCRMELPELAKLAAEYKGKRVRVIAINVDTDRPRARALLKELGVKGSPLEVLWDTQSKVVEKYNVPTMPSSYIVDERGIVRSIHSGFEPKDTAIWRENINRLLTPKGRS